MRTCTILQDSNKSTSLKVLVLSHKYLHWLGDEHNKLNSFWPSLSNLYPVATDVCVHSHIC